MGPITRTWKAARNTGRPRSRRPSRARRPGQGAPPFHLGNVPPRVEGLHASRGATRAGKPSFVVSGAAVDDDTRITSIEYSVDGGDWVDVFPEDGIFDARRETFRF